MEIWEREEFGLWVAEGGKLREGSRMRMRKRVIKTLHYYFEDLRVVRKVERKMERAQACGMGGGTGHVAF